MSPRKVQLDWKIGIKHCPCGQPNHLDETHCVKCGFGFESASPRSRQPFKMRRVYRFLFLTALVTYLTLYLSSPRIPTLQTIALAQTTEANIEIIQNRLLALTSAVDWQKLWLTIETSSEDWILTLATQIQTLEQQFTSWNEKIGQFELPSAQKVAQAQRDQKETAGTTSTPFPATPTPTPIPTAIRTNLDLVLDVQVQLGNVRTGPGMNYRNYRQGSGRGPAGRHHRRVRRLVPILLCRRRQTWVAAQQPGNGIPFWQASPTPECRPLLPEIPGCRRRTDSGPRISRRRGTLASAGHHASYGRGPS